MATATYRIAEKKVRDLPLVGRAAHGRVSRQQTVLCESGSGGGGLHGAEAHAHARRLLPEVVGLGEDRIRRRLEWRQASLRLADEGVTHY